MSASLAGIIWCSPLYRSRVRGSQFGDECVVCGRRTGNAKGTVYIWASPATGLPVLAVDAVNAPERFEVSGYPVGSDCLRKNPALRGCVQKPEAK